MVHLHKVAIWGYCKSTIISIMTPFVLPCFVHKNIRLHFYVTKFDPAHEDQVPCCRRHLAVAALPLSITLNSSSAVISSPASSNCLAFASYRCCFPCPSPSPAVPDPSNTAQSMKVKPSTNQEPHGWALPPLKRTTCTAQPKQ